MRNFLKKWNVTAPNRRNSAKFFRLLTSAMSKNEAILPKWKVECRADGLVAFFHSICLKYRACHAKLRPGHTKCCTCHTYIMSQNHLSRLEDGCSKMQPFSGNQRPDLLTYLMEMIDLLLTRSRIHGAYGTKRRLNVQKWSEHGVFHFYL